MKTPGIIIILLLMTIACTKATNPPQPVKTRFDQMFPGTTRVSWSKEGSKEYEAEFVKNGVEMSASFTPEGDWIETESEVKVSDVPAVVLEKFYKLHPKHRKMEAFRIEQNDGTLAFEIEYRKFLWTKEVAFDSMGNQK